MHSLHVCTNRNTNAYWLLYLLLYTGMSSVKMAISEIGVSFPDDTFGKESRFGVPFTVSNYS